MSELVEGTVRITTTTRHGRTLKSWALPAVFHVADNRGERQVVPVVTVDGAPRCLPEFRYPDRLVPGSEVVYTLVQEPSTISENSFRRDGKGRAVGALVETYGRTT